jgi:hypothetical protein
MIDFLQSNEILQYEQLVLNVNDKYKEEEEEEEQEEHIVIQTGRPSRFDPNAAAAKASARQNST